MNFRRASTKRQGATGAPEDDTKISSKPPSKSDLQRVADLPVLDASGKSHTFKSLYEGKPKLLIIFIRHFFCGNCQEYLRTLASVLTPESLKALPTPTEILVIGCGQPELIPMYTKETSCPFPIYADPTKELYKVLGMTRSLDLGPKSPEYMQMSLPTAIITSFLQALRAGSKALKGGSFDQLGGEFILEDGRAVWCHRMKNTRDHAEFCVMRSELGYDGEKPPARRRWSQGLVRSLSNRRQSWSLSRDRGSKSSPPASVMDQLKEETGEEKFMDERTFHPVRANSTHVEAAA